MCAGQRPNVGRAGGGEPPVLSNSGLPAGWNQRFPVHEVPVSNEVLRRKRISVGRKEARGMNREDTIPGTLIFREIFDQDAVPRGADGRVHRRVAAEQLSRFFQQKRNGIRRVAGQMQNSNREAHRKKRLIRFTL